MSFNSKINQLILLEDLMSKIIDNHWKSLVTRNIKLNINYIEKHFSNTLNFLKYFNVSIFQGFILWNKEGNQQETKIK